MAEEKLRKRQKDSGSNRPVKGVHEQRQSSKEERRQESGKLVFHFFLAAAGCLVLLALLVVATPLKEKVWRKQRIWHKEELKDFNGSQPGKPLLLSVLGDVFDVSGGAVHYGSGGAYNHFCGRDASRAFVSGNFSGSGLTDNVNGLSAEQLKQLEGWRAFYFQRYRHVGKLVGRFYTAEGKPSKHLHYIEEQIERAKVKLAAEEKENAKMRLCASQWSSETGGKVWCDQGLPRLVFNAGGKQQCACVDTVGLPNQRMYEGCDPSASVCYIPD